jgi:ribose-phosphate pyrophosphokinase
MILCFEEYKNQSSRLARELGMSCEIIQRHRFPDGESRLQLPVNLPENIIFCQSLDRPNEKLVELLLAAKTVRDEGAKTLTLIAPYLCYMRQDKAFHPGEVVSQTVIGKFLAELFENIITVDPHLHRVHHLEQAVPARRAIALTATGLMAGFLREHADDPVLLGPDIESEQWVSVVARKDHWQFGVCNKIRTGDKEVEITLPGIDIENRSVVIVDDVASSGRTLAVAARQCLLSRAKSVDVLVTHALFVNDAIQLLKASGVRHIWSTDSVDHDSNVIHLSGMLKQAVIELGK